MQLNEEDLYYLLALRPGEHVVKVWPDQMLDCIMIGVEGDDTTELPEVAPGLMAPRIDRPYAMAKLRERISELVARTWVASGPERDGYLHNLGELVEKEIFPHLHVTLPPGPTVS